MTLYDILKAARRKETANTDFMTVLRARSSAMYKGVTTVIKTITGSLPLTFNSTGANIADWTLSGNMSQSGTPTPSSPIQPQECGDLETTGEHTGQYKIPISSAGQTTPIYLGEVETERKIRKLVLTGDETFTVAVPTPNVHRASIDIEAGMDGSIVPVLSTHYVYNYGFENNAIYVGKSSPNLLYIIDNTNALTVADFKAYLQQQYAAGTPVTVWYVLSTPTTGIVNEPIRKIGTYADTISNAATIPTVSGSNTFDVSTTLKPSEATIKYYSADALRQLNITQGSKTKKKSTRKKGT